MPPALDLEGEAAVDLRAHMVFGHRESGERRSDVELGKRRRCIADRLHLGVDHRFELAEDLVLDRDRPLGRGGDLLLELRQLGCAEPHGARQRLAMDECLGSPVRLQRRRLAGGHLDEIAQHIVVPDLEGADPGCFGVAGLQRRRDPAAFVPERPCIVERRIIAGTHEAAVATEQGQIVGKRPAEFRSQPAGQRLEVRGRGTKRGDLPELLRRQHRCN